MDTQFCYEYRPAKRQKTGPVASSRAGRTFDIAWNAKQHAFDTVLAEALSSTARDVMTYVQRAPIAQDGQPAVASETFSKRPKLTTALITTGLGTVYGQLRLLFDPEHQAEGKLALVSMPAEQCGSVKGALTHLIKTLVPAPAMKSLGKLLNYDLEMVTRYAKTKDIKKVILFFSDGEAMDGTVLEDLVELFILQRANITFVPIFELATSVDLFQAKLSHKTIRQLSGQEFRVKEAADILDLLFQAAAASSEASAVCLGGASAQLLLDRQVHHVRSAASLAQSIKYAFLTHCWRQPLTLMLSGQKPPLSRDLCIALRDLKSFQLYMAELESGGFTDLAVKLQNNNFTLQTESYKLLRQSIDALQDLVKTVEIIHRLSKMSSKAVLWSRVYVQAMNGILLDSPFLHEILESIRKCDSEQFKIVLSALDFLEGFSKERLGFKYSIARDAFTSQFADLMGNIGTASQQSSAPLKSGHDESNYRPTTVVQNGKMVIAKEQVLLTPDEQTYTGIIDQCVALLERIFNDCLISPKSLIFHEILVFDLRNPLRDAFSPTPRAALERALSAPREYLACDCCEDDGNILTSTQPGVCILYQLLMDAGAQINIADLWNAWDGVVEEPPTIANGDTKIEDGEQDGVPEMNGDVVKNALFYRALAELRYLGIIKGSRKKIDHLTKMRWRGL